ncbi:sigma-70 family RNA polymerase sigma factor [Dactylosporangium sp. CA-152071]|uniref:sigma-70 family RNA polymerase sigma factor n=1 Tax=Dactylosporangium sp. CA-152071 TaxID=3239933 RepID=UPI003D8A9B26
MTAVMEPPTVEVLDVEAAYRELRRPLLAMVHRTMGGARDAEDVVQETFAYAWTIRDRFEQDRHPAPLIWTMARHQILAAHRRRRDVPASDVVDLAEHDSRAPAQMSAANHRRLRRLHAALDKLGASRRSALVLHYGHDMRWSDVADEIGIAEHNARQLGHNALLQVRELLDERPPALTRTDVAAEALREGVLSRLSPRAAEVAQLRYLDQLDNQEIARRLGISTGTVHSHLKKVNAAIRAVAPEIETTWPTLAAAVSDPDQLATLTPRQQQAVLLRFRDGLGATEAAQRLGIAPHAVTRLCDEARRRLAGASATESTRKFTKTEGGEPR